MTAPIGDKVEVSLTALQAACLLAALSTGGLVGMVHPDDERQVKLAAGRIALALAMAIREPEFPFATASPAKKRGRPAGSKSKAKAPEKPLLPLASELQPAAAKEGAAS